MSEREQQILGMIRADPLVSQQRMADRLGISRSAVAGHVMNLTRKGLIRGRGYVLSEQPYVAVVGGANVDIQGRAAGGLALAESNPGRVTVTAGGVARNVAEALARLGVAVRLVTAIGDDEHGEFLLQSGRAAGIDMGHVLRVPAARTSTYLAILDDDGDLHVAVADMDVIERLDAGYLDAGDGMLDGAALVVADTNLPADVLAYLARGAGRAPLFADTVSAAKAARIEPHLAAVHTLKAGLAEAEAVAHMSARSERRLPGLAGWFHDRGVERVVITLGSRGVFFSTGQGCGLESMPALPSPVENASGAGDALLAGLVHGWLAERPTRVALRYAMAAAGLTLASRGTIDPGLSAAGVEAAYRRHYAG